jgi:hypothetical protein
VVVLAAGSIVAHEKAAFPSSTSVIPESGFNRDYGNDRIAERVIDEQIIERYASFDPSDGGRSGRYSISFDLENEDSDWNFEVTVTVEF